MNIYIMPNGVKRQYEDGEAPEGAKLFKPETKAVTKMQNKAVETTETKKRSKK